MPNKSFLIFLDFDGVTHPRSGGKVFDTDCLSFLSDALHNFNCNIVVSSSWREEMEFNDMVIAIKTLNKMLLGCTPIIDDPFLANVRHHEIQNYLDQNYKLSHPLWIAIDDTPCFFKADDPVFYTDGATGFNEDNIQPLIDYIEEIIKG